MRGLFQYGNLPTYQKTARKMFENGTYHKYDAGLRSKRIGPQRRLQRQLPPVK